MIAEGYKISFCGDENVLKLTVEVVSYICEFTESHQIIHLVSIVWYANYI